jgi:hypothetical protein
MKIKIDTLKSILDLHSKNSSSDEIDLSTFTPPGSYETHAEFAFPGSDENGYKITVKRGKGEEPHDVEVMVTKVISF